MKISSIFLACIFASGLILKAQVGNSNNGSAEADAIVPSDFFIEMLNATKDQPSDPMGTQRLIQVKDSSITPVMTASTAFKYTSNPDKIKTPTRKDGSTLDLSLNLSVGLGEYGIGDDVLAVPSFSFMQMRTFTDPARDYGDDMKAYDVDVQVDLFTKNWHKTIK